MHDQVFSVATIAIAMLSSSAVVVTVDNTTDLNATLMHLQPDTTIEVAAGHYEVTNPVRIDAARVSLIGVDSSVVVFSPKNAGEPIIAVSGDDVTIRGIELDGKLRSGDAYAAFAVFLDRGVRGCHIEQNVVRRFQATAIIGPHVVGCTIEGNAISDAAGDGVQLRGSDIVIAGNTIHSIFDEPVDLEGENVTVRDNKIALGRIGIALGAEGLTVVRNNVVADQYEEGIVVAARGSGEISNNIVVNSDFRPYQVWLAADTPDIVSVNNVACRDGVPDTRGVGTQRFLDEVNRAPNGCADVGTMDFSKYRDRLAVFEPGRYALPDSVARIPDPVDRELGQVVVQHLSHFNPGILSLTVQGETMRSEISSSLALTLSQWPDESEDPVRWPFLRTSGIARWVMSRDSVDVVQITHRRGGPRMRISVMVDGELTFRGRAILFWDRIVARIARWFG